MHVSVETLHGGWVGMGILDVCELVGKWFAGCHGWRVGCGLVGPTNTNAAHQPPNFSVKRCAVAHAPYKVGVWVIREKKQHKKQCPGVNKCVLYTCAKQIISNTINNYIHQAQRQISIFYDVLWCSH